MNKRIIFTPLILVGFLVLGFASFDIHNTSTAPPDPKSGKQTSEYRKGVNRTARDEVTKETPSKDSKGNYQNKFDRLKEIAPQQASILNTITHEYTYYALRTPNDPGASGQWSLSAMQLPTAWDTATGNGVVVAVIDSGFALNHEDLVGQWQSNVGELGMTQPSDRCWTGVSSDKSTNSCDDDNNGYADDYRGWDFIHGNNTPQPGEIDPNGDGVEHGTMTAGLVGMTGNNNKGSATASWSTKVMPLQALDDDGSGYTSDVVAAVYYAVDNGAKVINMSLGGSANDPALQTAINYAYQRNVVVVAAAGNCGTGQENGCDPTKPGAMGYPALNNHVIAVGATNNSNSRASFSSYGDGIDLVAPGSGSITTSGWTASNQTTTYFSTIYGTSFSSPYVASVAALIKAVRPNSTVDDITAILDATATKVPSMNGQYFTKEYGHGLVNAAKALQVANSLNISSTVPTLLQSGSSRSEHNVTMTDTIASGCESYASTYCTARLTDVNGFDRYLPYQQTDVSGKTGWTWYTSSLSAGSWSVRAVQGDYYTSTPYLFGVK